MFRVIAAACIATPAFAFDPGERPAVLTDELCASAVNLLASGDASDNVKALLLHCALHGAITVEQLEAAQATRQPLPAEPQP